MVRVGESGTGTVYVSQTSLPVARGAQYADGQELVPVQNGNSGETITVPGGQMPERDLENAVKLINQAMEICSYRLNFVIDRDTKDVVIKVIDNGTNEVIREIPPESVVDMMSKFKNAVGIFVDMII